MEENSLVSVFGADPPSRSRPEIFGQRQKYGIAVWQSRNPPLTDYVKRIIDCVSEELNKVRLAFAGPAEGAADLPWSPQRTLRKVALVIKATGLDETPLERFVFDFEWLVDDSAFTGEDFRSVSGLA